MTFSLADRVCLNADAVLRAVFNGAQAASRPNPAQNEADVVMKEADRRHAAGLMRINHTGEVCAQALYHGQSLTAKLADTREQMQAAQKEEIDHLVWCQERLSELGSHTSHLNPLFYALSFSIGALAGAIGDKWSLGFVAETEQQVVNHLESHLDKLPAEDLKSAAILNQMRKDEAAHQAQAKAAGGADLPKPIQKLMQLTSRIMTKTTYRV